MSKTPSVTSESAKTFTRVRLYNVPANMEDIITGHSFDFGASGLTEALHFSQPDLTYDPDLIPVKTHTLDVFFESEPSREYFDKVLHYAPRVKWDIVQEEHKDWLAEWKKGFHAFQLVGDYWVVPSWEEPPPAAKNAIRIDPGMAFGTGTHATTKMASYFVHKLCSQLPEAGAAKLLDVGTGTAILAMLAYQHGVRDITGLEIDPEARRVARENLKLNNMSEIKIPDDLLEETREQFDIVIANIIDGVLINLKPHLLRVLAPGGNLFLTGILLEREEIFLENFVETCGLSMVRRIENDEWVGYWLKS